MAECKKCGLPIDFRKTANGRWMPVNIENGRPHFPVCGKDPDEVANRRSRQKKAERLSAQLSDRFEYLIRS